jgi:thiol peroxidase
MTERPSATTLKGRPLTLVGPELKVGETAPDFATVDPAWTPVTLASTGRRVRVFSVVPSLDTSVCSAQTKRMNEEAARLGERVGFYSISADLPYAARRWCGEAGVRAVTALSDHFDVSFGTNYGTLVKELRIECRAVFVLDPGGVLRHVEYVKEIGDHPRYDDALTAVERLL